MNLRKSISRGPKNSAQKSTSLFESSPMTASLNICRMDRFIRTQLHCWWVPLHSKAHGNTSSFIYRMKLSLEQHQKLSKWCCQTYWSTTQVRLSSLYSFCENKFHCDSNELILIEQQAIYWTVMFSLLSYHMRTKRYQCLCLCPTPWHINELRSV